MPTENRSSNSEMVSVQATIEALEEAHAGDGALDFMGTAAQLLRQFQAQSAEQHQGAPVAYIEAADLRDIACGSPWGGTVWGRQSREPYPPRVPVYTHADPGEVKRLRAALESACNLAHARTVERDALRAQLAKQDALLRELADAPPAAMEFRLQQKVKAALSASAEPASKSRWVDWHGGECPVPDGAEVEYSLLGNPGKVFSAVAARLDWQHDHRPSRKKPNICRYRIKQASASAEPQVKS